ncbi:MAG: hypothetical protein CBD98_003145 [Flavobacteriaceae bacterium TMED238]|nr:MAG: hypothetical protein CBD98_003145 [Flavobacteriaceae bacterium TMED238]
MVKYKDTLINFQILLVFLIPITPHISISTNIELDDIPVILFLIIFIINIYFKNFKQINYNQLIPICVFTFYIFAQNIVINNEFIFSDGLRYVFYTALYISLLSQNNLNKFDNLFRYLTLFLNIFSIIFFFLQLDFGTDSYNYWKMGFNENQWVFTDGRMNGFQAGGPNAFGGLIAALNLYCISNSNQVYKRIFIITGILGCFFTYSRAAMIVLLTLLTVYLILSKNIADVFLVALTIIFAINFGLLDRFTSEVETEGIQDRVAMQQATISDISTRGLANNLFGYGHNNYGIVRSEIQENTKFSSELRPTGPHNSFLFIILDYGFFGLLFFIFIFIKPVKFFFTDIKSNIINKDFLFLGSFVALSLTGDFIQNHSISILFFLVFFKLKISIQNEQ